MKVVIVHGWGGHPQAGWFPWLRRELEKEGFEVEVPQMPDTKNPRIQNWVPALAKAVGTPCKDTHLLGHSLGCQTIARYLERLPDGAKIGGAVFVAGFFKRLTGLENDPGAREIEREWLGAPIDFKKVKARLNKSVAIFSDNDPYVPLDNQDDFINLGSEIVIAHEQGHFNGRPCVTELPCALEAILRLSGRQE